MTQFYALKRKERAKLVHEQLAQAQDIPSFLRKHWQKETGFAFPSGHTMFAASWALLAAGLLWPRRRWGTIAVLLVWATAVMGSRGAGHALAAGSHRRHADLTAAGHGGLLADAAPCGRSRRPEKRRRILKTDA